MEAMCCSCTTSCQTDRSSTHFTNKKLLIFEIDHQCSPNGQFAWKTQKILILQLVYDFPTSVYEKRTQWLTGGGIGGGGDPGMSINLFVSLSIDIRENLYICILTAK